MSFHRRRVQEKALIADYRKRLLFARIPCASFIGMLLVLFLLCACGREGPPSAPEGSTFPRRYPNISRS